MPMQRHVERKNEDNGCRKSGFLIRKFSCCNCSPFSGGVGILPLYGRIEGEMFYHDIARFLSNILKELDAN